MSNKVWRAMWKRNDIPFHQAQISPILKAYLPQLNLSSTSQIVVPLCGKTLDMNLFSETGHHVVGIELSVIAIKAYFDALKVNPSRKRVGAFTRWSYANTEIWCGDIFDLSARDLENTRMFYDCASLTAFPSEQRQNYIKHFYECLPQQSQTVLLTTESPEHDQIDSAHQIDQEVLELYQPYYQIQLLHGQNTIKHDPQNPTTIAEPMQEKLYLMTRR